MQKLPKILLYKDRIKQIVNKVILGGKYCDLDDIPLIGFKQKFNKTLDLTTKCTK